MSNQVDESTEIIFVNMATTRKPRRVNDHDGAHLHGAINVHDRVNVDVNLDENSLQPFIISVEEY